MSAETSARTVRQADGLDPVRALQRVLYRSAKQDRTRRFHALFDKVARNAASSWSQSGHLEGRVRKIRKRVTPTLGSLAMALWLGTVEGLAGQALLASRWTRVLDRSGPELLPLTLQAKQLGLIHARAGGGVIEIDASRLGAAAARL